MKAAFLNLTFRYFDKTFDGAPCLSETRATPVTPGAKPRLYVVSHELLDPDCDIGSL